MYMELIIKEFNYPISFYFGLKFSMVSTFTLLVVILNYLIAVKFIASNITEFHLDGLFLILISLLYHIFLNFIFLNLLFSMKKMSQ